jgi:hypothetical protein
LDKGDVVSSTDDRFGLCYAIERRFLSFSPISVGAWSVFAGESAHFLAGVYIGADLCSDLQNMKGISMTNVACVVDQFSYKRMIIDDANSPSKEPVCPS